MEKEARELALAEWLEKMRTMCKESSDSRLAASSLILIGMYEELAVAIEHLMVATEALG